MNKYLLPIKQTIKELPPSTAFYLTALLLYLIPISAILIYGLPLIPGSKQLTFLCINIAVLSLGSCILILFTKQWELFFKKCAQHIVQEKHKTLVTQSSHKPSISDIAQEEKESDVSQKNADEMYSSFLKQELGKTSDQLNLLKKEHQQLHSYYVQLRTENDNAMHELKQHESKEETHLSEIQQKDSLLAEYQHTIREQRTLIENKQETIRQLEAKIRDLRYEIKAILQLGDMYPNTTNATVPQTQSSHPVTDVFDSESLNEEELATLYQELPNSSEKRVQSPYDASLKLRKCLDIATKLTGASHLSTNNSSLLNLSVESYAIDLRRLFDSYRSEQSCVIILYSRTEDKLLFANSQVKGLIGWNSDRFVSHFTRLIQKGLGEWKQAVHQLNKDEEKSVSLLFKTRTNESLLTRCQLALIPSGVFANHVVGILYPA